jgi:hypothetical protein
MSAIYRRVFKNFKKFKKMKRLAVTTFDFYRLKTDDSGGLMQKKAIRTISNAKYNEHTGPLFQKHQILPNNLMQKKFILSFMHGIEYGYGQESFIENWLKNSQ